MVNQKFSPEVYGQIDYFLSIGWSFTVIQEHLKANKVYISRGQLSKIKNRSKENVQPCVQANKPGPKPSLDTRQINRLRQMASKVNPPVLKEMAKKLESTVRITQYALKKDLGAKLVKKPKGHFLTDEKKEKRRVRAWKFYRELKCDQWSKVVTSDESWFYLSSKTQKTDSQYLFPNQTRADLEIRTHQAYQKRVMVWAAISARGPIGPIFVDPGAKINKDYYIDKILKPMIKDFRKLYPDGDGIFHQDSAPSHAAEKTLDFLRSQNINFFSPEIWLPNSPDLAPCDYFLWGYLKTKVTQRKVTTLDGLKKVIKEELYNIPQEMINKALKSWPSRIRQVYMSGGDNYRK